MKNATIVTKVILVKVLCLWTELLRFLICVQHP